jgi:hypothetical protein
MCDHVCSSYLGERSKKKVKLIAIYLVATNVISYDEYNEMYDTFKIRLAGVLAPQHPTNGTKKKYSVS